MKHPLTIAVNDRKFEIGIFAALLLALNILPATDHVRFNLYPEALFSGEWWRWLTFPWRHISLYHLILDGSAFLLLYQTLRSPLATRLQHLFFCVIFSGLVPLLLDDRLSSLGLCGLSGVAHGFMLICALESAAESEKRACIGGVLMFAGVLAKTLFEQVTGDVFFAQHHFGNIGTPIASCHYGGVIGGLTSYCLAAMKASHCRKPQPKASARQHPRNRAIQKRPRSAEESDFVN
jgi:rhomboid family GlyGly-CTERM serine protease